MLFSYHSSPTVVRAFDLPKISKIVRLGRRSKDTKFYGILSVDGERERAKIADPGSAPEWKESFSL